MAHLFCRASIASETRTMPLFDYTAPAELYVPNGHRGRTFHRFATAAEAAQFAVQSLTPAALIGTRLVVDQERYNGAQIRELYAGDKYPLNRKSA
jgi:hypothetical protein